MSDEHHEHDGGHELEALDAGQLFRIIGGLSVVVLISIIAVVQWFHKQQEELRVTRSDYSFLEEQRAREGEMLEGIDAVATQVAADPKLLAAPAPPEGWVHPDDIKTGGKDAAAMGGTPADAHDGAGEHDAATPSDEADDDAGDAADGDDAAADETAEDAATPDDDDDAADDKADGSGAEAAEKSAPSEAPTDEDSAGKTDKAANE